MKKQLAAIAAVVGAAAVFVLLLFFDPAETVWFPPCPFHWAFHLYCPGCGAGRGLYHLIHGNAALCFRYNPLTVPALLLVAALVFKPSLGTRRAVTYTVLAVVVSFWVLRNIPVYPFTLLAPP